MLESFSVSNFKSIKHIDTLLRPFMVLVGPNGAGKTNFVQALALLGAILEQGTIDPVRELGYDELIRREKKPARSGLELAASIRTSLFQATRMRRTSGDIPDAEFVIRVRFVIRGSVNSSEVRLGTEEFRVEKGGQHLLLSITEDGVQASFRGDTSFLSLLQAIVPSLTRGVDISGDVSKQISDLATMSRDSFPEQWLVVPRLFPRELVRELRVTRLRLDSSTLRQDALTTDKHRRVIGPAGEGLALVVDRLRGHGPHPSAPFLELLSQLNEVYPRIEDVEPTRIQPGRLVLLFREKGIADKLGQTNISDGVLHALAFLLAINPAVRDVGVLAVEEPENAIHPWPLRRMLERAQATNRGALIITTHSPTVVSAIKDPRALFVVEQVGDAGTKIHPAHDKEQALDAILRESGKTLGEIWLEGGIGGIPSEN